MYRDTDRFENWFITSLQTDVNDTTSSFRLNKALNVREAHLVLDPYDEDRREIVKVTSVDGTLVYVERGVDNTSPQYHNDGAIVVMHVIAADLNDLYADWAEFQVDLQQQQDDFQVAMQQQQDDFEDSVNTQISDVEALAFLAAHPVGSTYWNETDSTNPGTLYGGTWVQLKGVVLGGISDVAGSPFNVAAGTTIGADTHTLTTAEMPSHSHRVRTDNGDGYLPNGGAPRAVNNNRSSTPSQNGIFSDRGGNAWHSVFLEATGGGGAHNNIQRTLVGYLWKRTA